MPYLLRVALPDVPGSLGRLATAIGEAGGDIEAIEIVEKRHDGTAVDDVFLEMVDGAMPDAVVSACTDLDGVEVLWINRYAAGGNIFLDLEAVEDLTGHPATRARPAGRPAAGRVPLRLGRPACTAPPAFAARPRPLPTTCPSSGSTCPPDEPTTSRRRPGRGCPLGADEVRRSSAGAAARRSSPPSSPGSSTSPTSPAPSPAEPESCLVSGPSCA